MAAKLPRWTQRPDVLEFIVDSYVGLDASGNGGPPRRVFIWEEGSEIVMGNCEAFSLHLRDKFGLLRVHPSDVHALLRALGEQIHQYDRRAARNPSSPAAGRFKQPDPDKWVVGKKEDT
jgi:hypothetical protein